jgi:hypothetical protein
MNRRGLLRATALAVVLLLLPPTVMGVGPMTRTAAAQGAPDARVTLADIDPVVTSGSEAGFAVVIEHTGDAPWSRLEVIAELHGALGSRSALRTALAGGAVPARVQQSVTVAATTRPVPPGGVTRITGAVPLTGAALSGPTSAVHPLRLQVLADGVEVGRIDTAVVRVGARPTNPLATTLVWPLAAPPARAPDGDPSALLDRLTLDGGRLDTLLSALAGLPSDTPLSPGIALHVPTHLVEDLRLRAIDVPSALVDEVLDGPPPPPPPETVDEAALRAALLLERLRTLTRAQPSDPVTSPYGDADLGRLLVSGPDVAPLAARAVLEGTRRLPLLVGRAAAPVMLLEAPVSPAALDLLPTRVILVPHEALEEPDLALDVPLGEPVRALRSPTGRIVIALVGDPYMTIALGTSTRSLPGDPVRSAHEIMVRTAMVHLEAPGRAGRALVLLPPTDFDPDRRFAAELLERLAAAPWLAPSAAEELAAASLRTGAAEPARLLGGTSEPLPGRLVSALTVTGRDLALLAGAVDPSGAAGDEITVGARALRDASDELMRASSRAFARDVDGAIALLAGVRAGVDEAFGALTLSVNDVTLTDRDGTVPIGVARDGGAPLRVRIEVSGPSALTWTDGRVRELSIASGETRAIEVPVRSGATGRFPVTVLVTDPSGQRVLATDVVGVRATAVAGPALVLIGVTVLVLTVVGTLRQRRRGLAWRTIGQEERIGPGEEVA